jgi:hypothetical protein
VGRIVEIGLRAGVLYVLDLLNGSEIVRRERGSDTQNLV